MEERNEIKHIVEALYKISVEVGGLNPDPTKPIGEHSREQKINRRLLYYSVIVSTGVAVVQVLQVLPVVSK